MTTEAVGIFQGDVIVRTAITAALKDLRKNPWLLDYVFASLPQDDLTAASYGEKSATAAKEWFLKTEIPVVMVPRLNDAQVPCISVKLLDSTEAETTLGDIHYQPSEDNDEQWNDLCAPFTVSAYDISTGTVTVPATVNLVIVAGMFLIDKVGQAHEITEVLSGTEFTIAADTAADFRDCTIRGARPTRVTHIESVSYRETYQIGVHVSGEPVCLTWLHSILVFTLFRYKQAYLEARGFGRSTFGSSDFQKDEFFETEFVFSRYVTLSGFVTQYWPKAVAEKVTSFGFRFAIADSGHLPPDTVPEDQLWVGSDDLE